MKNNHPKAVPLVTYTQMRGYSIHPEAIEVLRMLPEHDNYSVINIVGKSKTGKSFLLNQLIEDDSMFPVSSHLGNCTKGIMLATNFIQVDQKKVLILDTEGFGSMEGSDDRDCKLFVLSLLLSTVVIYNSFGTIDEQTLNNLSMIIEVGKMFQKQIENKKSIPALFWVLRDFSLQLLDKNGFPITPVEYLQNSLEQQKGSSQAINHKNRIRRVIKTVFSDRTCSTLVLPNTQIPSQSLSSNQIRTEFKEDVKMCRKKLWNLINKKGCKQFCGQTMTISSFLNALQIYVESFNRALRDGSMPKIQNMTFQLRQNQAKGLRVKFYEYLKKSKEGVVNSLLTLYEDEGCQKQSSRKRILQPIENYCQQIKNSIYQLTGSGKQSQIQKAKATFFEQIEKQCQQFIEMRDQFTEKNNNQSEQELEVNNLCQFFYHLCDENELDHQYNIEINRLKEKIIKMQSTVFSNWMMKLQIAYLRRKLQLCKEKNLEVQRVSIELQYAKKDIVRLETRNKQLEDALMKQNKNNFATPIKDNPRNERSENQKNLSTFGKEPGYIRNTNQNSLQICPSKQLSAGPSTSKIESSSFYIPYVLIQKSEYLNAKIIRTLIKEDSKRNNYIQYVIDVNLLGQKWSLNRKFKDFSQLHSILVMMFQNQRLPECKSIVGPLKLADSNSVNRKEVIQQRRRELENYLFELSQTESIRNSRILQKFLKINKEYTVL